MPFSLSRRLTPAGYLLLAVAFILTAYGIVMIYSASSIMALNDPDVGHNAAYYLRNQLIYSVVGAVAAFVLAKSDYHFWSHTCIVPIWVVTVGMLTLALTSAAGLAENGSARWIGFGPVHLQPSEFAKVTLLMLSAMLMERYFEEGTLTLEGLAGLAAVGIGLPLVLILKEPDKGTVLIIGLTVFCMLFLAGFSLKGVFSLAGLGLLGIYILSIKDDYSRARIEIAHNPWLDPLDKGYQLIQGYHAVATGGLLGVGLGMSRQKYAYLPYAHTDFILSIVGEELGFVGLAALFLLFVTLVWLGFRVAREAPDLSGRLIAAGAVTMIGIQLLVNAAGVFGLIALSGKPVPFMTYGGSSIMATLMLVGLVLSVSGTSSETVGVRPTGFRVVDAHASASGLRVLRGGSGSSLGELRASRDFSEAHAGGRIRMNANGTRRIDLTPGAADRLRGRVADRGGRG